MITYILLLMLKYQISILIIFNIFFQYCIDTDLYTYTIEKKPSISLCIRILRGHSLHHPSFVAVVHHSFMDIFTYYTV